MSCIVAETGRPPYPLPGLTLARRAPRTGRWILCLFPILLLGAQAFGDRTSWQIGRDDQPTEVPYRPAGEFSVENGRNDPAPGAVTRLPGDPEYPVPPAVNPAADDDFYFAGTYPPGFNGLTAPRVVPFDEPPAAWERALTQADRTNRVHFELTGQPLGPETVFRLTTEFVSGALRVDGVAQPGIGSHEVTVRFRNGAGVATDLDTRLLTAAGPLVVEFSAAEVQATRGPNTLEFVRSAPTGPGVVAWLVYDHLLLEAVPRRTSWQIGRDDQPTEVPYRPAGEFSVENGRNDPAPGAVTRLPGDPEYPVPPAVNPAADDDFYFAGTYPPGFNGLTAPRVVPFDEPPAAWERALTQADRTNRIHFLLEASQAAGSLPWTLRSEFVSGGTSQNGVLQPGFGTHDLEVRFRNGHGVSTRVYAGTWTRPGDLQVSFSPESVRATEGPNSLEIVRTGPNFAGTSAWILHDYVTLAAPGDPGDNSVPVPPGVADQHLPLDGLLSLHLNGPRLEAPGIIAYAVGDSITDGSSAFPPETSAWNALVARAKGWPLTNLAFGCATISDINWQLMPGFVRTNDRFHGGLPVTSPAEVRSNHLTLMLTGYNDGRDGFGRPQLTAYQEFYRASLQHAAAYMAIPTTGKTHAQAAGVTGAWSSSAIFGGRLGRTSSAGGGSLTFTNLVGRAVYIGYLATATNNLGSFSVAVDGQPAGRVQCTGAFGNRAARSGDTNTPIPPNVGLLGDSRIFESPLLLRIGGLAEGPHTVTLTVSPGSLPVTILWAAGSTSARAGLDSGSGPSVWIGGTLRSTAEGYIYGNDEGMAVFTRIQAEVAAQLASDGLHVQHVRAGDYFDPGTGMGPDTVHPNNLGHSQIAAAFLEKMVQPATDADSPPQTLGFSLVSGPAGMQVTQEGRLTWSPSESQAPSVHEVLIRVTDNGLPARSSTNGFRVTVREANPIQVASVALFADIGNLVPICDDPAPAEAPLAAAARSPVSSRNPGSLGSASVQIVQQALPATRHPQVLTTEATPPGEGPGAFGVRTVIAGQSSPWDIAWGPDQWIWYIERTDGRVARVDPLTGDKEILLTLGPGRMQTTGQDGLLGFAIHPDFDQGNPFVYVSYTHPSPTGATRGIRVARYTFDASEGVLTDPVTVLEGVPGADGHPGGRLGIGPDGGLYIGIGDLGTDRIGGLGPLPPAQDPGLYSGKIHRVNLDVSDGSWIPGDNPFRNHLGHPTSVFSLGHRNPQGMAWATLAGMPRMYAAEVGPFGDDEINLIERGSNHGWPLARGFQGAGDRGFDQPLVTMAPLPLAASAAILQAARWVEPLGLEVYTSDTIPGWRPSLLVAARQDRSILRFPLNDDGSVLVAEPVSYFRGFGNFTDVVVSPDGRSLYVTCDSTDPTVGPDGEVMASPPNPGSILEFRYLGPEP